MELLCSIYRKVMKNKIVISLIFLISLISYFYLDTNEQPLIEVNQKINIEKREPIDEIILKKNIVQPTLHSYEKLVEDSSHIHLKVDEKMHENVIDLENSKLDKIMEKISNGEVNPVKILSSINTRFNAEDVDHEWAVEFESDIYKIVSENENQEIIVSKIHCKSTLCKLNIDTVNQDKMMQGIKFSKLLSEQEWGKDAGVYFNYLTSPESLEVVVTRDLEDLNRLFEE